MIECKDVLNVYFLRFKYKMLKITFFILLYSVYIFN